MFYFDFTLKLWKSVSKHFYEKENFHESHLCLTKSFLSINFIDLYFLWLSINRYKCETITTRGTIMELNKNGYHPSEIISKTFQIIHRKGWTKSIILTFIIFYLFRICWLWWLICMFMLWEFLLCPFITNGFQLWKKTLANKYVYSHFFGAWNNKKVCHSQMFLFN